MTVLSEGWRARAACAGLTHIFYLSEDDKDWEARAEPESKRVCQRCPVIDKCLPDELCEAVDRKKTGNRDWLTLGVVGGSNRFERLQMLSGDDRFIEELHAISKQVGHAGAQALREAWEVEGPEAEEIVGLTDEEIACKWGSTPATAQRWRMEKGIIKPRGMPAWKETVNEAILDVLSDGRPHRRQEVRDAAAAAIPYDKLQEFAERASTRLGIPISDSRAATHMTNHYLHTLGESRRGMIRVWEDEDGERWVAAIQRAA